MLLEAMRGVQLGGEVGVLGSRVRLPMYIKSHIHDRKGGGGVGRTPSLNAVHDRLIFLGAFSPHSNGSVVVLFGSFY